MDSNIGLLAGTVIRELRMHPYITEDGQWDHKPEYLEFIIEGVSHDEYVCRYCNGKETFFWPVWRRQPRYGFLEDGSTPVRYYISDAPVTPPYEGKAGDISPYGLRCAEIDRAALLVTTKNGFAALAAEPEVSYNDFFVCLERPSKKFFAEGGCPFYQGRLNYGSGTNILCKAVREQLHGYVAFKFCESGRKIYCPIWRAEAGEKKGGTEC